MALLLVYFEQEEILPHGVARGIFKSNRRQIRFFRFSYDYLVQNILYFGFYLRFSILSKEEYISYKGKYEAKIEQLSEEVSHLEKGLKALDKQMEQHRALKRDSDSLRENRELTAALIDRLIDRVEVSKDKQITVRYRFESEFDSCEEVLNQCKNM